MLGPLAKALGKQDDYAYFMKLAHNYQNVFDPKIGFMAHAFIYQSALNDVKVLAPAKSIGEMSQIVINDYVDTALCVLFVLVVVSMVVFGIRSAVAGWRSGRPTVIEAMSTAAAPA